MIHADFCADGYPPKKKCPVAGANLGCSRNIKDRTIQTELGIWLTLAQYLQTTSIAPGPRMFCSILPMSMQFLWSPVNTSCTPYDLPAWLGKWFRSGWWSPDLAKGAGDADTEVGGSKDLLEQAQPGQRQQEGGVKERQGREESRSPQYTRRGQSFISARVTASTAAADSAVNHEAQLRVRRKASCSKPRSTRSLFRLWVQPIAPL